MVWTEEKRREIAAIGNIIYRERSPRHIYTKYGYDGTEAPLCKCNCGGKVKRDNFFPHDWNDYIYGHHNVNSFIEYRNNRTPEEKRRDSLNSSLRFKEMHAKLKENNPDEYSELQSRRALDFHKKNPTFAHENSLRTHRLHPGMARNSYLKRIENDPWYFMGVPFGSHQESNVAKLRFELLGIVPIDGENCHVCIENKEFDFEQIGFVHEYHPENQYRGRGSGHSEKDNRDDYYKKRREVLDSNGHKKSPLIVTTTPKEAKNLYLWLSKKLDFTPVGVIDY